MLIATMLFPTLGGSSYRPESAQVQYIAVESIYNQDPLNRGLDPQ